MRKCPLPARVAAETAPGLGDAVGFAGPSSFASTGPPTPKRELWGTPNPAETVFPHCSAAFSGGAREALAEGVTPGN